MTFYLKSHLFISSATSHPILRRSHHRSRHGNAPAPPMIIVFILVTSPVRARRATPRLRPFHPPHSVSESPKPRLPALCFTQNPNPTFPPNIFTLRPQSHRQDDPAECNGVGEDHAQYSDVNPQKAELSLGEILGAANGFLYPIVNIQSLVLAKLVDLKPLVLHCLLIAAYSDVSVNHILVVWDE